VGNDGNLHVAWEDHRAGDPGIYYKKYDGIAWSPDTLLTADVGPAYTPSIATASGGRVNIVWSSSAAESSDIHFKLYDGSSWKRTIRLTYAPQTSTYPSLAIRADSVLNVVWQDERHGSDEIYWMSFPSALPPEPEIVSMEPDSAYWYTVANITDLAGDHFASCAQVWLRKAGEAIVLGSNVNMVSTTQLTCDFDLAGIDSGYWDVVVNVGGQLDTLVAGFRVVPLPGPVITGIEPDSAFWYSTVEIADLAGDHFCGPAEVRLEKLGQPDVNATDVMVVSETRITCDFDLTAADSGYWDVVVQNLDGQTEILGNGFRVIPLPAPQTEAIQPAAWPTGEGVDIAQLTGANFDSTTHIYLHKPGEADIDATEIVVESPSTITCQFDLGMAATGYWDVIARNFDGQEDTLSGGFQVLPGLWEEEVRLTSDPARSKTSDTNARCIATDSAGGLHVVWYDNRDGQEQVYYKSFDGISWGADQCLSDTTDRSNYPAIAVDPSDNIHVVWRDQRDGDTEVYYKRHDGTWSADTRLTKAAGQSTLPAIAAYGSELHVVWQDDRDGDWEIYYMHYDGSKWEKDVRLTDTGYHSMRPSVAVDDSGNVHVAWAEGNLIGYKKYDGTSWSSIVHIDGPYYHVWATVPIYAGPGDSLCVAWAASLGPEYYQIYCSRFDGMSWGPTERLTDHQARSIDPSLVAGPNGSLYVVWSSDLSGSAQIHYSRSDGAVWQNAARLTQSPGGGETPSTAIDGSGNLHIVWTDGRHGEDEIYYRMRGVETGGIDDREIVGKPSLLKVAPNPIRDAGYITLNLPRRCRGHLAIYDITGRLVLKHNLETVEPGQYGIPWDGCDLNGRPVAAGVYFLKATVGEERASAKIVVLK
jgi:hypothetical protein